MRRVLPFLALLFLTAPVSAQMGRSADTVRAVAVDSENRVLVMGATDADPDAAGYTALVVRLRPSGRIDGTYGKNGRAYATFGSSTGQVIIAGHADSREEKPHRHGCYKKTYQETRTGQPIGMDGERNE